MNIETLSAMAQYAPIFTLLAAGCLFTIIAIMTSGFIKKLRDMKEEEKEQLSDKESLKNFDISEASQDDKDSAVRLFLAPDGVDPNPLSYLTIMDQGKEVFLRSFTIDKMPKRVTFAETFAPLLNYDNCTSSIFIDPVDESKVQRMMDRHIVTLEAEFIGAEKKGDTNRRRKLQGQYSETNAWAEMVEAGEASFYQVGFLFTLRAESLEELNKVSDSFHTLALGRSIGITSCYGVQSEAYLSNAPLDQRFSVSVGPIKEDGIKMHLMDQKALSTIFNHTQCDFSHKNGIPLGRNLMTGKPVTFDVYDSSHDGYTTLIVGKTGSGKSATVKIMCSRYRAFGYKFAAVDSQAINAVGEYAAVAELMGGTNFQIKAGSNNILNIFEVSESKKFITKGTVGKEVTTLELNEKIAQVENTLLTMIQGSRQITDSIDLTFVEGTIIDLIKQMYASFGIIDGHPESLYEQGQTVDEFGNLTIGRVRKKLPIISDFFKILLHAQKNNKKANRNDIFDLIVTALKDYVREVYYTTDSLTFLTAEEFASLPISMNGDRIYLNPETGLEEIAVEVRGIRSYFDGQSTVAISKDCPFTNFDISQLPESEKVLARQICIDFVNEQFIKKNSENANNASYLVTIFDEAHENFASEYCRKTIDNVVRTARKRHVSCWISTQALKEYDRYPETQSILRNAAVKMIFKQDYQDRDYLMKALNLTPSQTEMILNLGGNVDDKEGKNARRGETCIVDGGRVAFVKVDYLKAVEAYAVETDLTEVRKLYSSGRKAA